MKLFSKHKNNLIGCGIILLLFLISIQLREENLKAPLSRHHEWISAHALITAEVWSENGGPSAYNFSPVYTKKGAGNESLAMLNGVTSKEGDVYYVSYPPFSFISLYYTSQLFGGPTVTTLRINSLFTHFAAALLLYFLIGAVWPDQDKKTVNFAGIIAAGFYIFARGNLWSHGNLYFADQLMQPIFIGGILLSILYLKGSIRNEKLGLLLFFIVFFLGTYTEWLGLLSSFFIGIFFLLFALVKKQYRFIRPFFVIAFASSFALGLTIYQYSSINSWEKLKEVSEKKYDERSGRSEKATVDPTFNLKGEGGISHVQMAFDNNYKSLENFTGLAACLFIIIFVMSRTKRFSPQTHKRNYKYPIFVISLMALPIFFHYLLFFNFNSMHDFSGMKTSSLLVVIVAILIQSAHRITLHTNTYYMFTTLACFSVFFIVKSFDACKRYQEGYLMESIDHDRIESALMIRKMSDQNTSVFTNVRLSPEQVYYANHSIFTVTDNDTTLMRQVMTHRKNYNAHYYHHSDSKLKYCVTIKLKNDKILLLDTLTFNPADLNNE